MVALCISAVDLKMSLRKMGHGPSIQASRTFALKSQWDSSALQGVTVTDLKMLDLQEKLMMLSMMS